MNKETGGPAFPSGLIDPSNPDDSVQSLHIGMTLRDYFAAKAMQSHVQREDVFEAIAQDRVTPEKICAGCYAWADAMLKAREQ